MPVFSLQTGNTVFILLARHIFKILIYYHMGLSFLQHYYESYVRDKQWFFCNLGFHKLSQDYDGIKSVSCVMPNKKALKRLVALARVFAWIMQLFVQMLQQSVHCARTHFSLHCLSARWARDACCSSWPIFTGNVWQHAVAHCIYQTLKAGCIFYPFGV